MLADDAISIVISDEKSFSVMTLILFVNIKSHYKIFSDIHVALHLLGRVFNITIMHHHALYQ